MANEKTKARLAAARKAMLERDSSRGSGYGNQKNTPLSRKTAREQAESTDPYKQGKKAGGASKKKRKHMDKMSKKVPFREKMKSFKEDKY